MPAIGGFFSFGSNAIGGQNLNACNTGIKVINHIDGGIMRITSDGRGSFSRKLAAGAAAYIRSAIRAPKQVIGSYPGDSFPLHKDYIKQKRQRGYYSQEYMMTGTLLEAIKVLNRRYKGGRFITAGIDQRKTVARVHASGQAGDGMVKVSDYAEEIEFGHQTGKARLLISTAIGQYIRMVGPEVGKGMIDSWAKQVQRNIKTIVDHSNSGAMQAPSYIGVDGTDFTQKMSYSVEKVDNSTVGESSLNLLDKNVNKEAKARLAANGVSAEDQAYWESQLEGL